MLILYSSKFGFNWYLSYIIRGHHAGNYLDLFVNVANQGRIMRNSKTIAPGQNTNEKLSQSYGLVYKVKR